MAAELVSRRRDGRTGPALLIKSTDQTFLPALKLNAEAERSTVARDPIFAQAIGTSDQQIHPGIRDGGAQSCGPRHVRLGQSTILASVGYQRPGSIVVTDCC